MQNTQTISTKYLRDNLAEVLERVAIGKQSYAVAKFGKVKANIVPVDDTKLKVKKKSRRKVLSEVAGIWKDREDMKDSAKWVRELRRKQSIRIRD